MPEIAPLTLTRVLEWHPCYSPALLQILYAEPVSVRDMLTRTDGAWRNVSNEDRIWTATRPGCLPRRVFLRWLATVLERAIKVTACEAPQVLSVAETLRLDADGKDVKWPIVFGDISAYFDQDRVYRSAAAVAFYAADACGAFGTGLIGLSCAGAIHYGLAFTTERIQQIADLIAEIDREEAGHV